LRPKRFVHDPSPTGKADEEGAISAAFSQPLEQLPHSDENLKRDILVCTGRYMIRSLLNDAATKTRRPL
jgi:hypothetical protein